MTTTVKLNPEQEEIRGVARGFLQARFPSERVRELMSTGDGFEESSWKEIADLGWTGIALPEERGGAGYGVVERCLLLEEMGRVLYGGPYLSSAVLAADALTLAATEEAGAELLTGILDGSLRATLVAGGDLLGDPEASGAVTAAQEGEEFRLSGSGGLTLDAATAQTLIVVAALEDGSNGLFALERSTEDVTFSPGAMIDETRKTGFLDFDGALARRLDDGSDTDGAIAQVLDRGAIALAAEMVGGAQQAIDMTVAYLNEREQFGGPIGRFQALKHRLADISVAIDAAREGVYSAADAVDSGELEHVPLAAAAAKSAAGAGYSHATAEAIQLHGGIGFTDEHDIGLYYKRALSGEPMLGSSLDHLERIAVGLDV
jgi:alkylation response protein AidB-like acyl-CoA dehydrogenase